MNTDDRIKMEDLLSDQQPALEPWRVLYHRDVTLALAEVDHLKKELAEACRLLKEGIGIVDSMVDKMCKPCGTTVGNLPAQFGQLYKYMQAVQEGMACTDTAVTWEEWAKDLQARFGLVYRDREKQGD